jgi:hypothetical protein
MVTAVTLRGLYLVGNKRAQRIRAVHTVDSAGRSITLRLREYISRGIQPEFTSLPWQEDVGLKPGDLKTEPKQ